MTTHIPDALPHGLDGVGWRITSGDACSNGGGWRLAEGSSTHCTWPLCYAALASRDLPYQSGFMFQDLGGLCAPSFGHGPDVAGTYTIWIRGYAVTVRGQAIGLQIDAVRSQPMPVSQQ